MIQPLQLFMQAYFISKLDDVRIRKTDLLRYTIMFLGESMNLKMNVKLWEKPVHETVELLKAQSLWISILFYRRFA